MAVIIVNATALESSGGVVILKQFIEAVPVSNSYIIFVSNKVKFDKERENIGIIPICGVKSLFKRFFWDIFGLAKWLKKNKIKPNASISLQNTNFRTGYKIPNYIYFHQSIPFSPQRWSLWKREHRTLWFYKNVYPYFVSLFINKRTQVFVQLQYIRSEFAIFFNFPKEKIHVINPNVSLFLGEVLHKRSLSKDKIVLFYPSTMFFYKNHQILIEALNRVNSSDFILYLTCDKQKLPVDWQEPFIECIGFLSHEEMWGMYQNADALVFPSYIETYGLPLIEAASVGIPILVADLPYAREVLDGYEGATFVDYADVDAWVEGIKNISKNKKFKPYRAVKEGSWDKLFEIININL